MEYSRRHVIGGMAALTAAAVRAQGPERRTWKPKLGLLTAFQPANIEFARQEGFTSLQLNAGPLFETDEGLQKVNATVEKSGLFVSVIGSYPNHTASDPAERKRINDNFARVIEAAGALGVAYIGTTSGHLPGRPLNEQVSEIVRIYTEHYFPLCEKHHVRLLWEPWAGGPNIATGPIGYEALFKAFGNSPYVGLQFDPSHFVWQFIDPIQCARDFVDKIYDVHLKDIEILWPVLRRCGINPPKRTEWWRFRLPGSGCLDWEAFFTVLQDAGYQGAMNIEHEDVLYGWPPPKDDMFTPEIRAGFRVAHQFLKRFVPEGER